MMKILGAALVFFCILQIGRTRVRALTEGKHLLFDIWFAVSHIGEEIARSRAPLAHIYQSLAKSGVGKTDFFAKLAASGDFKKTYRQVSAALPQQPQIPLAMTPFLELLGTSDVAAQVALCKETAAALSTVLADEVRTYAQKKKMYLAVAVCVGGMVVLLLL